MDRSQYHPLPRGGTDPVQVNVAVPQKFALNQSPIARHNERATKSVAFASKFGFTGRPSGTSKS